MSRGGQPRRYKPTCPEPYCEEITMREIKFRAWDKKEKKMSESLTLREWIEISAKGSYCVGKAEGLDGEEKDNKEKWAKENRLFLQFTGLKDKNGKEIYEGDIVEASWKLKYEIIFDNGTFMVVGQEEKANNYFIPQICHLSEVIGNIYENPELLKQK